MATNAPEPAKVKTLTDAANYYNANKTDKKYADYADLSKSNGRKMPVDFKAFKKPFVKWSIRIMACSLVIAWIVMMIGAKRLHEARKIGEWKQQECGREYMEAETARYEMSKVYEDYVRRYIYVALAMFMFLSLSSLLLMTLFSLESFFVVKRSAKLPFIPNTGSNVFEKPGFAIGLTIVVATLALIAQVGTLSGIWGDRMSEKSYNQATSIAQATDDISKKQMPALIQATVIGTLAMAAIVFVMYTKMFKGPVAFSAAEINASVNLVPDAPPINYLITLIFMFVIGLALTMGLVKGYGMLNGHFSEYRTKTEQINGYMKDAAEDESTKKQARDYLINNIRRVNPGAELSVPTALNANYGSDYYGYTMHEDGTEVGFLGTNRITVARAEGVINVIKDDLTVLFPSPDVRAAYNKELDNALIKISALASLSGRTDVYISAMKDTITKAFAAKFEKDKARPAIYLNDALRLEMTVLFRSTPAIKLSSVREFINAFVNERAQKKPNMGTAEIIGIINSGLFANVFKGIVGDALDNVTLEDKDTRREAIINWFKCPPDNLLSNVILLEGLDTYIGNRVAEIADNQIADNKMQSGIRDGMSMLRQNPLDKEADNFIGMVYIWSLILIILFAYLGFHRLYMRGPQVVMIGSIVAILALVLALSFYGWFMGQVM